MKLKRILFISLSIITIILWLILIKNANVTLLKNEIQQDIKPKVEEKAKEEKEEITDNKHDDINIDNINPNSNYNYNESNESSYQQSERNESTSSDNNSIVEYSKSDLEIAIELQLEIDSPVTYYNGHLISMEECQSLGNELLNNRSTTFVFQYECPRTTYGSATVVGLIVGFQLNGVDYHKSYDEYKNMMNN